MTTVLAPVSAAAYRNDNLDWYGVAEIDADTGEHVWRFDAVDSGFETAHLYQDGQVVKHSGFRPSSVQRLADGRTLVAGWRRGVIVDEDGVVDETFTHELMNDVHEIQRTSEGTYLVASTGMDTILYLDEEFEELWSWHMWEHLDPATRPGEYYPHRAWYRNPKNLALNPDDRYHLNYATFLDDPAGGDGTRILCSALNYGVFVVEMNTGEIVSEYRDLEECHNPYPIDDRYVVPESGADRVVEVDRNGRQEVLFDGDLEFVKDADPTTDADRWIVTDTKNDRVLLWDRGDPAPSESFHLGEDANPYEADYLGEDAVTHD